MNILIGTHGKFGKELIQSAEMIVGKMENISCVSLLPEMSFEDFMNEADQKLASFEGPTIALVDLFGGTPCNVLTVLSRKYQYEVITGVNLPMLIDLSLKCQSIEDVSDSKLLVAQAIETLKESAVHSNARLEEM
ncbi:MULTISPECIES: PTS mannose transporter subunit IIAB [unclassified Breznakia]|uniref:PTS sugar transporter subunit IIA n=1 Tax=unclassified Breznakia TaxID=2623764 RepID=UPI002474C947|nr:MULTISPECIES: PTS mannose transporter subunit IIAB [unclassified Breznakia]MDH6368016.1 PTS system mannose-specific IIA component [Breznakia sp. PH1-1]MDH6405098.1 PTS system mannose-specific IIA component [Breznakia sp. PF1-11]MDH6412819.1 PTS system mannose-specific IIA component [Breznakia sp. PFB1-11]MDH6415179.1 PTS system mannose-specific IIA component [Breznakia sp. PFB1-14]MDH6417490.1 PTS system mannose-specific IIA component [Breznakia sp. PFB1-4]